MAQWVAGVSYNQSVVSSNNSKSFICFLGNETLPSLVSTGWFQDGFELYFITKLY